MADSTSLVPVVIGGAAGIVSAAAVVAYSVFSPRCQFWAPVIRSIPQRDAVALTFDDGPDGEVTPRILDTLAAGGVTATFFVIGRNARKQPELLRRMVAEGHGIGNHTLDHHHFGVNRNAAYWRDQIGETQKIVADATGVLPVLFRPPMGFKTRSLARAVKEARLPIVAWSARAYDTREMAAEKLAGKLLKQTAGHDVVLLHDGVDPWRRGAKEGMQARTAAALGTYLAGLPEKKLRVVDLVKALLGDRQVQSAR